MKYIIVFFLLLPFTALAQKQQPDNVYSIIKEKDSLLFDAGYNNCDISQFQTLLSDTFEFYHDEAGTMLSKDAFIASVRDGLCKMNYKAKRVLQPGSLRVFPLYNHGVLYGAVETGSHSFYAIEKGKPEYLTSTADFTQLWLLQNGKWKLSRVLSYNHVLPAR